MATTKRKTKTVAKTKPRSRRTSRSKSWRERGLISLKTKINFLNGQLMLVLVAVVVVGVAAIVYSSAATATYKGACTATTYATTTNNTTAAAKGCIGQAKDLLDGIEHASAGGYQAATGPGAGVFKYGTLYYLTMTTTYDAATANAVHRMYGNNSLTGGTASTAGWQTLCRAAVRYGLNRNSGAGANKLVFSRTIAGEYTGSPLYQIFASSCGSAVTTTGGPSTPTPTPAPTTGNTGSGSGFITTSGMQLMQNGKPYKSVGFNFSPVGSCWSSNWSTAQMDQFFQSVPANSIARFFAPPGGTDSVSLVQSIVKEADKYNVHLLISLAVAGVYGQCDAADAYSTSGGKTAAYYTNAVKAGSPYANWVKSVVTPLANDPGVAMWEIVNEPWHGGATISQAGGAAGATTYTNAAAALIRAAETAGAGSPKQLITLGPADIGETGGVSGMESIFKNIDVVDDHDYSGDLGGATAYQSSEFPQLQQVAKALNKPYMVDETGVEAGSNCSSTNIQNSWDNQRAGLSLQGRVNFLLTQKATSYARSGASYVGFWLYTAPGMQQSGCTYENITPSDPIMAAVKAYSIP